MRVLLTNDDGIDALGLRTLREALVDHRATKHYGHGTSCSGPVPEAVTVPTTSALASSRALISGPTSGSRARAVLASAT